MNNTLPELKPGDILAIGTKSPYGFCISATTFSYYSHIAVVASNSKVYEYVGGAGIKDTDIDECLNNAHTITVYKRPIELNDAQKEALKNTYNALKASQNHSKYSTLKAIYAGLLPITRNVIWSVAFGSSIWGYLTNNTAMYILTGGFLLITPAISLSQWFCRRVLQPCGVKWAQDLGGDFCSSFSIMLDAVSGGLLHRKVLKAHEPRPKDVVSACKQSSYTEHKIK